MAHPALNAVLLIATLLSARPGIAQGTLPNFLVILTDDQRFDSLFAMPIVQARLGDVGVVFNEAIVTTPLCCPFRGSFLGGGALPHRTGVIQNTPPNGGAPLFPDADTLATRLQQAGYATGLLGKYMNGYSDISPYVPPGWTVWEAALNTTLGPNYQIVTGSSGATSSTGTTSSQSQ